ncbi:MAG: flagellar protein FlaG [Burkholderiaceae bacterium]
MNVQPSVQLAAQAAQASGQTNAATQSALPVALQPTQKALVAQAAEPSTEQLSQAVASINATIQKLSPGLEFSIDQESNRTIVRIVDQQTKELIRQMPSAETLEIAKALDRVQGLLISLRA